VWGFTDVILAVRRLRQENQKLEASLGYEGREGGREEKEKNC
jgi:hypothetical protein